MSALAVATDSINLGQGFPDTDGPPEVLDAAVDAIRSGHNQYPPGPGTPELRAAIARHQQRFYGLDHDPDGEVLVTAGATEALAGALLGMLDTGDEVIVFEPMYDSYQACIALAGARAVPVLLQPDGGRYGFDADELRARGLAADPADPAQHPAQSDRQGVRCRRADARRRPGDRPRPHRRHRRGLRAPRVPRRRAHPDGDAAGHGRADADDLVGRQDVQHDRVEGRLDVRPATARRRPPAPPSSSSPTSTPAPFQPAIAVGLDLGDEFYAAIAADLTTKRDHLVAGLRTAGFTTYLPEATYFTTVDIRPVDAAGDGMAFCRTLPERCGVVAIPNEVFYARPEHGRHLVRFACCKRLEVLDEAAGGWEPWPADRELPAAS